MKNTETNEVLNLFSDLTHEQKRTFWAGLEDQMTAAAGDAVGLLRLERLTVVAAWRQVESAVANNQN